MFKKIFSLFAALTLCAGLFAQAGETELFVPAKASFDHSWGQFENPEATWDAPSGTLSIEIKAQSEWQWGNQVFLATGITALDVTKEYQVSFDIVASTADCGLVTFKAFDDNQIAMANQTISVTNVVQTWSSEWTKPGAATANGLMVWDFGWDPVQTVTITNISVKERDAQADSVPVVGDQFVDETSGLKFEVTAVGEANTVMVIENGIIIPYSGTSYTIPATVKYKDVDFAVTAIGAEAFSYCSSLESVTIPASVTTIGQDAFDGCSSLQSVTLSEGLLTIGEFAFEDCSALASINIPASVTTIGKGAFNGCESLQSITIPEGVTTIGESAFQGCESLQSVTLPEGLLTIGNEAFSDCDSLLSITIPASVTTIGAYAFNSCDSLQSVTLSEGLLTIGTGAFLECSGLASITIPASVTTIGEGAFGYCAGLTSVTFLGNACQNAIGEMAFMSVGDPDPALLTLPNSWTGTLPDEDGNWYGGKFELSEVPTALPTLFGDGVKGNKFLDNGQVIIRKNNKTYNTLGQEVK